MKETYSDLELSALLKKPDIRKATFAEYRDWVIINFLLNCGSRAATARAIHTELQLKSLKKDFNCLKAPSGDAFLIKIKILIRK